VLGKEVRDLIRRMSIENPLWGAPKIHGELLKLGTQVGIALATAVMYLRILAIIAVFNWSLAAKLTPSLLELSLLGFVFAGLHGWCAGRPAAQTSVE
jgi:hypothetical protein